MSDYERYIRELISETRARHEMELKPLYDKIAELHEISRIPVMQISVEDAVKLGIYPSSPLEKTP